MATLLSRGSGKGSGPIYMRPKPRSGEASVCRTCRNWGLELLDSQCEDPTWKVDFYDVAESADLEECRYCYAIYQTLMVLDGRINLDGYHLLTLSAQKSKPFYVSWDDTADGRVCAEVYRRRGEHQDLESPSLLNGLGYADIIEPDASSDVLFSKAKQCLNNCLTTHPACQQVASAKPKRLLYIGSTLQDRVRLIEDVPNDVKFIALSHCWGTNDFRTIQSNLCERMRNIPWDEFPKTLQDVVIVSRKLEVRYVWIDSLCIIQDDRTDWASESARMGAIYGGAHLTIAAASAPDNREGFLVVTEARKHYESSEVDLFPFSQHSQVLARRVHDARTLKHVDPLTLRWWTFQERLLPRRLMTYTQGALSFECITASCCECGSGLRPDPFLRVNVKELEQPMHHNSFDETRREGLRDLVARAHFDSEKAYDDWYFQIVKPFTHRKLSQATDTLPAISAVAEKFQAVLGDHYLAGLWNADLKRGLLWRCRHSITHPTAEYRAPSWSWASAEGPIDYGFITNNYNYTYHLKVHDVQCTRASPEIAFGEISEGWLLVSGQVWTVRLDIWPSEDGRSSRFSDDAGHFAVDGNTFETGIMEQVLPGSTSERTVVRAPRGQRQNRVSAPVTLLLGAQAEFEDYTRKYVLVLARVAAGQEVYRRIGCMFNFLGNSIINLEVEEKMIKII